jgi:hypothetical protein
MIRFFLSRVLTAIPTLFIIITLAFFLTRLAPGGPFDSERALDPEIAKNLRRIYQLDRPLIEQFWLYLQSLAQWRSWAEPPLARLFRARTLRQGTAHLGNARRQSHAHRNPGGNGAWRRWRNEQKRNWSPPCRWRGLVGNRSAGLCHRAPSAARFRPDASYSARWRLEGWGMEKPNFAGDHARFAANRHCRAVDGG